MTKGPTLDWVCDRCGRKVYKRRTPPKRCHAPPMRPMGSPWKHVAHQFHSAARLKEPSWTNSLSDDYWVSPPVLERLQRVLDAKGESTQDGGWQGSVRAKVFVRSAATFLELAKLQNQPKQES